MTTVDWERFDLEQLTRELRSNLRGPDGEKMIWAFEEAVRVARIDEERLGFLLVALVCLLAKVDASSPRSVLDAFFRRSVSDEEWQLRYLPLCS